MDATQAVGIGKEIESAIVPLGEVAATALGQPEIAVVLRLLDKYGPTLVDNLLALFQKKTVTVDDLRAAFAPLKVWESYGIPDKAPPAKSVSP